jgi:2C-methyl-D-erythritol 2,4-cyclodiphosphate synthase
MKYEIKDFKYYTVEEKQRMQKCFTNIQVFSTYNLNSDIIINENKLCYDIEQIEANLALLKNTLKIKEVN